MIRRFERGDRVRAKRATVGVLAWPDDPGEVRVRRGDRFRVYATTAFGAATVDVEPLDDDYQYATIPAKDLEADDRQEETMRDTLRQLEEAKGDGRTFADFEGEMVATFLKAAIPGIKQVAKGHAQRVQVKQSRSTSWLEYEGEDASDLPMEFEVFIVSRTAADANAVVFFTTGKRAGFGIPEERHEMAKGVARPQFIVDLFQEVFGAKE